MQLSAPTLPFVRSRAAEELQRALDGRLPVEGLSPTIGGYAAVAERLGELVPTTTLRPSPEYRAELHARLVDLATARPGTAQRTTDRRAADRRRAVVPWLPWLSGLSGLGAWSRRGWRRTLAATTGAVLTLMVGVGFAAGSALPGGLLYPVKELIQSAQVQLAGGGMDRGTVLLDQARGHIKDASTLVGQGSPDPADVNTALTAAGDDLRDAQKTLLDQFARTQDPAALTLLAQFAQSQAPLLADLRGRVPVTSEPLVDDLLSRLGAVATSVRDATARCGAPCASVPVTGLPGPDGLVGTGSGPGGSGLPGQSGVGGLGQPGTGGVGGLGGLGGLGGVTGAGSGTGGGADAPTNGVSIGSGGVGVQVPGVGATVPAPGVSAGSGGVRATVPPVHATVGSITATLPGVGVSVPPLLPSSHSSAPSASSSSSSSSVCVLIVCIG